MLNKLQLNLWLRYTSNNTFYDVTVYVTMNAKPAFISCEIYVEGHGAS